MSPPICAITPPTSIVNDPAITTHQRRRSAVGLVDVAHWAGEFPWCAQAATLLEKHFGAALPVAVSPLRTDPWNIEYETGLR